MTSTAPTFMPSQDRKQELRRAFGCFGTGVTVVTTHTGNGPLGMTANSFSSVSLEPPLVLWAPATSSKRHDAFVQANTFCIQVLSVKQLDLAHHFASQGSIFDGIEWAHGPLGDPVIADCLAEFHCTSHAVYPAGDHSIVVGEVQQVVQIERPEKGLLFERGRFGQFAGV